MKARKWFLMPLKVKYSHYHPLKGTGLKKLTPKQILQRLLIVLIVKTCNASENLLNEILQIIYSL